MSPPFVYRQTIGPHERFRKGFGSPVTTAYAIIQHPELQQVLLTAAPPGWSLPVYQTDGDLESLHELTQAIAGQHGLDVLVLRELQPPHPAPNESPLEVYLLHLRAPRQLPLGARWSASTDLDDSLPLPPLQVSLLRGWFADTSIGIASPLRSPWADPAWYEAVAAWIRSQVADLGMELTGPIQQVRSWSITSILRVPTSRGDLIFKAAHPMFRHEAALTQALSTWYRGHVPAVVAADPARNWFLMEAFEGPELADAGDLEHLHTAVRLFARLQIESLPRVNDLFALGCPDRRLTRLRDQFAALLADEAAMAVDPRVALAPEDIAALRELAPRINGAIDELASYELPATLIHGDLHANNIVVTPAGPLIFDWSDGAVAPPFFELLTAPAWMEQLVESADDRAALRRAYLEPWQAYLPMEQLEAAFDRAQQLLPAYHAVSYHWIVQHTEPSAHWELGGGVAFFLRKLLRAFGVEPVEPAGPPA